MKVLLGTKNSGKIEEIQSIFADLGHVEWLTYDDIPFSDVIEDGNSFGENAIKKARQISQEHQIAVLAEDSGLVVDALNGQPGIHTARYAGENATSQENIAKLLSALQGEANRTAQFICVACLVIPNEGEWISEGALQGKIADVPSGEGGFGYDPIFIPSGFGPTLAAMKPETKNEISHRTQAMDGIRLILLESFARHSN